MEQAEQNILRQNEEHITAEIQARASAIGRNPEDIELLPVSKKQSIDKIKFFQKLGYRRFGENYAQELFEKAQSLANTDISWIFIGQLQSNKIHRLVQACDEIQTVASIKHAKYINRYSLEEGKKDFQIYITVNAGDEPQKAGVPLAQAVELAKQISKDCPNLVIEGIMAIPPASISKNSSSENIPELYQKISQLAKQVGHGKLSLGMTSDLDAALAVGSTCVRVGTGLFGARKIEQ